MVFTVATFHPRPERTVIEEEQCQEGVGVRNLSVSDVGGK